MTLIGARGDDRTGSAGGPRDAIASFARHDLRRRWRAVVVAGVLAGVGAGIGLACLAGARRTDTLFDRHLAASRASHVEIDPGRPTPEADRAIRSMPEVAEAGYWAVISAFLLDGEGHVDPAYVGALNFTTDGRYLDQDRVAVRSGRRLDPTRSDEVMLNEYFAEILHARVGTELDIGLAPSDDNGVPTQDTPTSKVRARVVGIMALPDEVIGAELDRVPKMFVSPAFGHVLDDPEPAYVSFAWYGLRLRGGQADVDRVVARWQAIADRHNAGVEDEDESQDWLTFVHRVSDLRRTADRSVSPMVAALATFGGLALFGALLLLTQGLARGVRQSQDDVRVGQVLGLTARDATWASVAVPAATVTLAVVVAAAVMIGWSSRLPAGPYRVLEPDPGIDVDVVMLALGLAALVVVPLMAAAVVALRQARHNLLDRRQAAARPSSVVMMLARAGAPPPVVSAVRLTIEPGRGRAFVPTRLVLVSSVVTVALLVSTLVFGDNLSSLAREPERFGWRADALLMIDGGYGRIDPVASATWLDARHDLEGWRLVGADRTSLNGRETPGVIFGPESGTGGSLVPVLVSGRAPTRAGEVVLGRRTLDELRVGIGDRVTFGSGEAARPERVTGVAVFPELGPVLAIRTHLDDGLWAHPDDADAFASLTAYGPPFNALLIDLAPGSARAEFAKAVESSPVAETGSSVDAYGVIRPAEVDTAASASRAQSALVAVVVLVVVLSLLLTLMTVVRRRRRDLAILAALGFTPRQLRITVVLQGLLFGVAGAAVGTPLGIALGRQLWRGFAGNLGVVADPTVAWGPITLAAVVVVATGILSSIPPALAAGRSGRARLAPE